MSLFPQRIERIREELISCREVPVPHGALADYVVDSQGRQWVRKKEINTGFQPLLAEAFGSLFASVMGVRMPAVAVQVHDNNHAWLSSRIERVTHWDEAKIPFIENLADLGGMLALDALLMNEDRHRQNILLQSVGRKTDSFEVWSIDLGNAVVGFPSDFLDIGLKIPDPRNLARGIPVTNLQEAARQSALRAEAIDGTLIEEFCREACGLVSEPTTDQYSQVLKHRCANATSLVTRYLEAIVSR